MKLISEHDFKSYEKREELLKFIKNEYPYFSNEEAQAVAKAVAYEEIEKSKKKKKPFHGYNKEKHSKSGGMSDKARKKYNRENNSDLKRPVTSDNPKGKAKKRKKSFCARMKGNKGPTSKDGKLTPKGAALKRWKC